jgi:hypothetical protein
MPNLTPKNEGGSQTRESPRGQELERWRAGELRILAEFLLELYFDQESEEGWHPRAVDDARGSSTI